MLAISVDTSSQVPYRSFPCRHGKSLTSLLLLFPKSLATFRKPCFLCSGILNACLTRRKGQHTFSAGQPYPLADIPFFHLCSYFIFNLPIPLRVFQNIIAAVPMSRFWANFLVFPVDGNFIHLILNWMGELYPPPNSPPKNRLS